MKPNKALAIYDDILPNNINIINSLKPDQKKSIMHMIPKSCYIDDSNFEMDNYSEISFYLHDGMLLQNVVKQEVVTKTPQAFYHSHGETIAEAILRLGIRDQIETIILYLHKYLENQEKIVEDVTSVSIINFN